MSNEGQPGAGPPGATITEPPLAAARPWTGWLLRLLLTGQAAMAVLQPILIGRYLDGDFDQLAGHSLNGSLLPAITMVCIIGAALHATVGRGPVWPVLVTVLLVPVEGVQLAAGYSHSLAVHIPLGTGLVAALLFLAAWSWTPRVRQTRPPRARKAPDRLLAQDHGQPLGTLKTLP
jgi:hypothetical protein